MKVVIVMGLAEQRGGGELMLLHLIQQGRDLGVDWHVVFLEDGPMVAQTLALGVPATVIPAGRLRQPHLMAAAVGHIAGLARRERADLLFGWMAKSHLYAAPAARLAKIPAVWYQLGMPAQSSALDAAATALPARGILTCSIAGARAQARLWPPRPLQVVYPGVELERFAPDALPTPAEARRRLGLPPDGPLIGLVGRLQRWKGFHVLVEAMPQILQNHPDTHAVLVGGEHSLEPDYPDFVRRRIADLGVGERVRLTGLQRNVPEWMQAMDVMVHASDCEPFGIVIIESMALGMPTVAGSAGGPAEIITDGVDGLLAPYEDAPALAHAVIRYLDDPALARRIGQAGRARAQEFSTRHYAESFVRALRRLVPVPDGGNLA